MNMVLVGLGLASIALAVTPTPDDVTIISPLAQLALGFKAVDMGLKNKSTGNFIDDVKKELF